jgi:hypothetical protein
MSANGNTRTAAPLDREGPHAGAEDPRHPSRPAARTGSGLTANCIDPNSNAIFWRSILRLRSRARIRRVLVRRKKVDSAMEMLADVCSRDVRAAAEAEFA